MTHNPEPSQRRYARHLALPEVGPAGQERLRQTRILCVGAGGLGSPAILYLAAAGLGHLGIVDFDLVDLSNLQRQILHSTLAIGQLKVDSAAQTVQRLNPDVQVSTHATRLNASNVLALVRDYDIVIDGTDNFAARYLVNDACVILRKPNVYGAIHRFEGQASVFAPHLGGPCYRCLYPEPPPPGFAPSCADAGVLGVLPGLIGTVQATEALKLALGIGKPLLGRLLLLDALTLSFREIQSPRDPGCPCCGQHPTITQPIEYPNPSCTVNPLTSTPSPDEIDILEMKRALDNPSLGVVVLDVREPEEHRESSIPGTVLVPLSQLSNRTSELNPATAYYIHCRSGVRSLKALQFLRAQGFRQLKSVRGGILAWQSQFPTTPG